MNKPRCILCGTEFTPESQDQDACSVQCVRLFIIKRSSRLYMAQARRKGA